MADDDQNEQQNDDSRESKPQEGQKAADDSSRPRPDGKPDAPKPPWGSDDEFNPEQAWTRIQTQSRDIDKLRRQLGEMEPLAKKAQEAEEAKKSEFQRIQDRAEKAEKERDTHASTATRLQVAMDKAPDGTPLSAIRSAAKRITGSSREELEADADDYFTELASTAPKKASAKDVIPTRPDDGQKASGGDAVDPKRIAREAMNRHNR